MNTPTPESAAAASSLLLVTLVLSASPAHASGNPWFDLFDAYHTTKGTAYTDSPDAAILAWQEGLMLRSYLNLYEASKNPAWLTEFATHFNLVRGKAVDTDGDGYDEWTTARYSPDLVRVPTDDAPTTGTFEVASGGDATLPFGWTRDGSTSATAFRTNAAGEYVAGGTCSTAAWGLELVTNGSTTQRLKHVLAGSYEPNHRYLLSLYGKRGGSVNGRASVFDVTAGTELASIVVTNTAWKTHSLEFTTPVAGHTLEVRLEHAAVAPSAQSVFFDNVRVSGYYAYHVLDGMISIPVANFVRLVHRNPTVLASFQTTADTYRLFLQNHVIAKWEDAAAFYGDTWVDLSATEGFYEEPMNHDTFATEVVLYPLPYNQYFALTEVQNILYDVTGNTAYLAKAENGAQYFRNNLGTLGTAYTWYYAAFPDAKVEDTSHSNVDMEFITEMYLSGSVFSGGDMEKFTDTLTETLWNQSTAAPELKNHVDGTPGSYCLPDMFSSIMYGWIPYAQFDPRVWAIAAKQYEAGLPVSNHVSALTLSQIIRWNPVKLVNQGFELAASSDATLPARWSRFLSTAATAYRDSANKTSGDYGLTLVSNGTSWQKLVQPWEGYATGISYTVTFDGKVDASGANGRVWIYNETAGTTLASYNFTNTAWQTHSFTFTSPATAVSVKIQLGHLNYAVTNGKAHYDNVSIRPTSETW